MIYYHIIVFRNRMHLFQIQLISTAIRYVQMAFDLDWIPLYIICIFY